MGRRSVLFTPGDQPDKLRSAVEAGADSVVFDLEDGVHPSKKERARETVRSALVDLDPECEVAVRVRPPGQGAATDLKAILAGPGPDALVLPKASDGQDVRALADLAAERDAHLPIIALVETAAGVLHAEAVAAADATAALVFGAEDLAAELGATRTDEGTEVLAAREQVLLAARAAGVEAIDTLYTDFEDEAGLREDTAFARQLGYDGKLAIHPAQVGPINETFTPDPERVAWAEGVLDAKAAADREGQGVFAVDGEMIDAPLVAQAERVLERAQLAGRDA